MRKNVKEKIAKYEALKEQATDEYFKCDDEDQAMWRAKVRVYEIFIADLRDILSLIREDDFEFTIED